MPAHKVTRDVIRLHRCLAHDKFAIHEFEFCNRVPFAGTTGVTGCWGHAVADPVVTTRDDVFGWYELSSDICRNLSRHQLLNVSLSPEV